MLKYKTMELKKILNEYKIPKKSKVRSERGELIGKFLEKLNASRVGKIDKKTGKEFKPLTAARVGMLLAPVKTKDLYSFFADCEYASNFSAYFWSRFKKK